MPTSTNSGRPIRLGVSPLSWTNDVLEELGGDVPLETCLREASEIGYEGVELGRKFPRDPEELSSLLSRYGLRLISGWYSGYLADRSPEAEWEAAAGHLRLLEACGCDVLVYAECSRIPQTAPWDQPLSQSPPLSSVDLPAYAGRLGAFAARLNQRGMKLAYHYHLKMLVETGEEIAAFFDAAPPQVGLLLDTGHAYAAGADYGELLRRFGNRVTHLHLKDVRRNVLDWARKNDVSFNEAVRAGLFTVPGDGDLDFSAVADFVRSSGYRGWAVVEAEQDPAKAAPKVYAQKAFTYVSKLLFS
jgi:inosose dehydratase